MIDGDDSFDFSDQDAALGGGGDVLHFSPGFGSVVSAELDLPAPSELAAYSAELDRLADQTYFVQDTHSSSITAISFYGPSIILFDTVDLAARQSDFLV